ncbi:MAG: hypothetical protein NC389_16785, partial [Acetatifactor muris]|nr:hypothetical protein [Acetatifactor muris]
MVEHIDIEWVEYRRQQQAVSNILRERSTELFMQKRNIAIVKDVEGNEIVLIHDIRFRGKRYINWEDVEDYLRQYIGEFYQIAESGDLIYIG